MITTFMGILNLLARLWWLWLIIIGPVFILLSLKKNLKLLVVSSFCVGGAAAYLALTPLEYLQIDFPTYIAQPPPVPASDGGMPKAEKFQLNLLPGFYEAVNNFFVPLLKQSWYIWIPGWFVLLFIARFNPPQERRSP